MPYKDPAKEREWYARHRERITAERREYRATHEHVRVLERANKVKHREKATLAQREYVAANREFVNDQQRQTRQQDPTRFSWYNMWTKYRLTPEAYADMLIEQDGKCAICRETPNRLQVDHDHETGRVRGLLCSGCNTRLGHLEKPGWVESATAYLERYR